MAKSFNAQMQARFKTITSNVDKVNAYVHETAMLIAAHAKEHGDCSTAQGLVMAMPASMRREMLILWFKRFTPIVVKNDDKWAAQMHKPSSKMFVDWNLSDGNDNPFYKLAEDNKEREPLDAEKALKMILGMAGRLEKAVEKGEVKEDDIPYVQAIALALGGLKVKRPPVANSNDGEVAAA